MKWLLPPVLLILCAGAMAILHSQVPVARLYESPVRWLGVLPLLAGIFLLANARRKFTHADANIMTFGEPRNMVTSGIYGYTRNPMYLGMVLLLAGIAAFLGTVSPWFCVIVFWIVCATWYIPAEEANMKDSFGHQYEEYKQRVNRWFGHAPNND